MHYVSKVGRIYVVTLTDANTWYQILTPAQSKGIRGFKLKTRQSFGGTGAPAHPPRPFDYAFNSAPDASDSAGDGFYSNSGTGAFDEAGPINGIWARSSVAAAVIELICYE